MTPSPSHFPSSLHVYSPHLPRHFATSYTTSFIQVHRFESSHPRRLVHPQFRPLRARYISVSFNLGFVSEQALSPSASIKPSRLKPLAVTTFCYTSYVLSGLAASSSAAYHSPCFTTACLPSSSSLQSSRHRAWCTSTCALSNTYFQYLQPSFPRLTSVKARYAFNDVMVLSLRYFWWNPILMTILCVLVDGAQPES